MLTVKELAELFGISRQAMRKHADKLGRTELLEAFEIPDTASSDSIETKLLAQLQQKDAQIDQLESLLAQQQLTLQANKQILLLTPQERLSDDLNKGSYKYTKNFKTSQSGYESPSEHKGEFTPKNEVVRLKQERQKKWWHFFREP
ncbi:helix-turn-helix domain-containing protein [Enterococcus casseliflavus]|uniref:helix-turn-helix domain-containing protein n=1 Tax=Enterococcus casseliflavus TaxID=37734 RepID=UPI001E501DD3|nr:helix-turn-helix domain-containing protein [Enterococcus casseliflavus]